jgi:hypothetical protein
VLGALVVGASVSLTRIVLTDVLDALRERARRRDKGAQRCGVVCLGYGGWRVSTRAPTPGSALAASAGALQDESSQVVPYKRPTSSPEMTAPTGNQQRAGRCASAICTADLHG